MTFKIVAIAISLCFLSPASTAQSTWYVDGSVCPGPGSGSKTSPFCRIQDALNVAKTGDTVLVSKGGYQRLDFLGKDVKVKGVEGPASTSLWTAHFMSGEGPGAVLDGFSLKGDPAGVSALQCRASAPTIINNIFDGISGFTSGPAIAISGGSSPTIRGNVISYNTLFPNDGKGGAMYISASSALLENNRVFNNKVYADYSGSWGGAIYIVGSNVTCRNNLFAYNSSSDEMSNEGGAIYGTKSTLQFIGNTFSGNVAFDGFDGGGVPVTPGKGGALYLDSCVTTVVDSIFWRDVASLGHELYLNGGVVTLSYSDVDLGAPGIAGSGAVNWKLGMLEDDPIFADGLFHLGPASTLIEAGAPALGGEGGATDGDLDPRVLDGHGSGTARVDIGWDEHNLTRITVTGSGAIGFPLTIVTEGPSGQAYVVYGALGSGNVPVGSFGSVLLDLSTIHKLGAGMLPGSLGTIIPPMPSLIGVKVSIQALAFGPGVGSFSRRVDILLH